MVRIASFNVNGLRAVKQKGKDGSKGCKFEDNTLCRLSREQGIDILCLQEIKTTETVAADLEPYQCIYPYIYTNTSKTKKGYSGVAVLSKTKALAVYGGFDMFMEDEIGGDASPYEFSKEGRILILEFEGYWLVNTYTPNSKSELLRLEERLVWDEYYRDAIRLLEAGSEDGKRKGKPVVAVGDLNVAREEIDLRHPHTNRRSPGFSDEERTSFAGILEHAEMVDTFRALHPTTVKYSFWNNMGNARAHNTGWRIDYVLVSEALRDAVTMADILTEYYGSDHCPVIAEIRVE
jgi:exodeoxyribonuclease-3